MEQKPTVENLRERLLTALGENIEEIEVQQFTDNALKISGYINTYHMTKIIQEFSQHFLTYDGLVIGDLEE